MKHARSIKYDYTNLVFTTMLIHFLIQQHLTIQTVLHLTG